MERYTPTPETRKQLIETYAHELTTDRTPMESLTNMCWTAVMNDFDGTITEEENEAVMTFMVAFFTNLTIEAMSRLS